MIKDSLEMLTKIMDKRDAMKYEFLKHIILLAATLLAVLVSLHSTSNHTLIVRLFWVSALVFLALGILFGSIGLYAQVSVAIQIFLKMKEAVRKQLSSNADSFEPFFAEPSSFLKSRKKQLIVVFHYL